MMSTNLEWDNINTVLLDLDGTLLDLHFDNHFWLDYVPLCYAEKHGLSSAEAATALHARYTQAKGSLDWYCVEFWTRELELDIEMLKHEVAHKISIHYMVEDFLQTLKNIGKRVVLVTNAHPLSLSLKMKKTGLDCYFDNMINAHELGLAKEHQGFWAKLQDVEPYVAKNTLLIDDNIEVLESAERYGINYLLAVRRPDTQGKEINSERFALLESFEEIMPA